MVSVTLSLVAFLVLIAWRFVFAGLQRGPLMREMAETQRLLGNNLLDRFGVAVVASDRFENRAKGGDPFEREHQAEAYLRRIVVLTGAAQTGDSYLLEVGTTRFHVRSRYVRRMEGVSDLKCGCGETCFCLPYTRMPTAEQIATALLELANNPALFDRWAARIGAVKADGQLFAGAQG